MSHLQTVDILLGRLSCHSRTVFGKASAAEYVTIPTVIGDEKMSLLAGK